MSTYTTHKSSAEGRRLTVERRAARALKRAGAPATTAELSKVGAR